MDEVGHSELKRQLGDHYLCRLPPHARLTKELWDVILFNINDPDRLQKIIDELFTTPPRHV